MTSKKNETTQELEKSSGTDEHSEKLEKLDSLSEILKSDIESMTPDAAFKVIDEWHSLVKKSKGVESKEIASGLKELQKLLQQDDAGHDIGELLSHLGTQTTEIAAEAEKGLKKPLKHLGKQLSKLGISLAKEDDKHHLEELETLTEAIDQDVEKLDSKSLIGDIDQWYSLLHDSDDEDLKTIASELKKLNHLLKGSKAKSTDISEKLIQLGEQTIDAASMANRGFRGAIKTLGKALTKLGKSIE
jgi:cob(I)alamin adenosyltransferase